MQAIVWALVIYWLAYFVACLSVVEVMQDWFYDEVTPRSGLKVAFGALILAGMAVWLKPTYDTMFTNDFAWTLLAGIVWVGVFILIFQFHPLHALGISLVTMILVSGLATLGVDSLTKPSRPAAALKARTNNEPLRRPLSAPTAAPALPNVVK